MEKIKEIGTNFSEKGEYLKKCLYEPHTLHSNPWLSVRECPNFLKICKVIDNDMGFQKKNVLDRSEKSRFYRESSLKSRESLSAILI
jgi:hypothetical protein